MILKMNKKLIIAVLILLLALVAEGINIIQDKFAWGDVYTLKDKVSKKYNGDEIIVYSAKLDRNGFLINIVGSGEPLSKKDIVIIDGKNQRFAFDSQLGSSMNNHWDNCLYAYRQNIYVSPNIAIKFKSNKIDLVLHKEK